MSISAKTFFYELWFPKNTTDITVIAPPSYDNLPDAELTSPNYALLDRLWDRDSIYAIGKLLSRRYPKATIHLSCSDDLANQSLYKNLVIIGGPGGIVLNTQTNKMEPSFGNEACRLFSKKIDTSIAYTNDCEIMLFGNCKYESEYDDNSVMSLDYGYFSSFKNPLLRRTKVIMLHGSHTLGVLGATRVFDGEEDSEPNFDTLRKKYNAEGTLRNVQFEVFFKVAAANGEVECPCIEEDKVLELFVANEPKKRERQKPNWSSQSLDLRTQIESILKVAIGNANLDTKKKELKTLLKLYKGNETLSEPALQELLQLCNENPSIPQDTIDHMKGVLCAN